MGSFNCIGVTCSDRNRGGFEVHFATETDGPHGWLAEIVPLSTVSAAVDEQMLRLNPIND